MIVMFGFFLDRNYFEEQPVKNNLFTSVPDQVPAGSKIIDLPDPDKNKNKFT